MDARLFPDYAATPTPAERRATRNGVEQHSLFDTPAPSLPRACPVCAGTHAEPCPHGTAPTLTRNPSSPTQVRAMFKSLGWPTT